MTAPTKSALLAALLLACVPAAACATPASASAERAGTKIRTAASQFGPVLFDGRRQAIYYFARERTSKPRCYGACAKAWPPVLAKGTPRAGTGARADLLGTTRRRNGKRQVTYDGRPLYYYAHEGPGQVLCHDVFEFGGLWLAVQGDGAPVPTG